MSPRPSVAAVLLVIAATSACSPGKPVQGPSTPAAKPGGALEVRGLPHRDPPKVPWLDGRVLHIGSKTVKLPKDTQEVAVTRRRIVTADGSEITARDLDGKEEVTYGTYTASLVMNAQRNIVAWLEADGTPRILQDGHPKELSLPKIDDDEESMAIAVTGRDCFHGPEEREGAGCSVYVAQRGERQRTVVSSNHGFTERFGKDGDAVTDVAPQGTQLVTVWHGTDKPTCTKIVGATTVNTCRYSPLRFSPNGSNVLGAPANVPEDGPVIYGIAMGDAKTGKLLARWKGTVWDWTWEDDTHALVLLTTGKINHEKWLIERVGLDGTKEIALPPTRGTTGGAGSSPLRFTVEP